LGSEEVIHTTFFKSSCNIKKYHTCLSIMKPLPSVQQQ
jgi:hypothetical protein